MSSRAKRRAASERMKAKACRVRPWKPAEIAIKDADHLQACSCWGCGNPRRHVKGAERLTVQERRRGGLTA